MTPDRWRRITEVFHLVKSCPADAHTALLDDACGDDFAMRADVEALLTADSKAGLFGETSLFASEDQQAHLEPGTRLGHYCIENLIGAGGMGAVYRAHDTSLDRDVAIKVLSTTLHDADGRIRLLREARAAAAVTHPHLCAIHEVGEAEGYAYIAMELIEGSRLDELIPAGGLPIRDVVRYGLQIADAIAHAHARGIIHRDLKPANVMISQFGTAKVLDFGLAKVLPISPRGDHALTATLTSAGLVAGTAGYMAPEQVLGRPSDERTDIFSFGVLLYEMATGRPAFSGATAIEVLAAVLHEQPPSITSVRPDFPEEFSQLVDKALDKDPARRYQQMSELSEHLRRGQDADAAISVTRRLTRRRVAPLAAAIAGAIALIFAASWTRLSPLQEGSDRSTVRPPSGPLERNSLAAYRAVTEASGLYRAGRWEAALERAKGATDLDPEYAEAWAILSKIYARLASPAGFPGGSIQDLRANALLAARRAVELDPTSYEGHVALALAHRNLSQIEPARIAARKAITLGPKFAEAYAILGDTYSENSGWGCGHDRDNDLAISLHRQAQSLGPPGPSEADGSPMINLLKYDKRYDEALRIADDLLRKNPTSRRIRRPRAWILMEVGRLDEAERMLQEAAADGGIRGNDRLYLAGIALKRGHLEEAAEGFEKWGPNPRGRIEIARQYIEANVPSPALVHLERGLRAEPECAQWLLSTKASFWSVIRSLPAARKLLEKYSAR